jgi:hypothetical protein
MNSSALITGLLAARTLMADEHIDLFNWCGEQWKRWLESQRSPDNSGASGLLVVAVLSCLEDLLLHVGVMQLLASDGFRCALILTFPTPEMTRLAQAKARREDWHGLVHMVPHAKISSLVERLAPEAAIAAFAMPAVLHTRDLESLIVWCSTSSSRIIDPPGNDAVFFGPSARFEQWLEAHQATAEDKLAGNLGSILGQIPENIAVSINPPFARGSVDAELDGAPRIALPSEDRIELFGLGSGGELTVSGLGEFNTGSVVVRQRSDLLGREQPFKIRMPSSFLTIEPQRVRIEARTSADIRASNDLNFLVPPSKLQPWMLSAFLNKGGGGNPVIRAFSRGVGCRLAYAEDEPLILRDIPVVWGVLRQSDRILAQAKAQGLYFFYIDHAYLGRGHGKNYRITRNRYEAGAVRDCPGDRLKELQVELQPWRKSGREIIVCPPTEYFMQVHDCADWLDTTLAQLERLTDRPVVVRQKPQPGEETMPLPQALQNAHALVTHSSNIAIEAACLGTPIFVAATSAAAPVGLTDLTLIDSPIYPDRERWLAHLAYNQFSIEEIGDGRAWRVLVDLEDRDFV